MPSGYVPKLNDPVFVERQGLVRYVVAVIDHEKKTADIKPAAGVPVLVRGVPWHLLRYIEEG